MLLLCSLALAEDVVLEVETWNVGLAHGFVDHAAPRAPEIWAAVEGSEADLVCLQEVWNEEDREAAVETLAASHPHTHLTENEQLKASKSPACRIGDLFGEDRFVSCLTDSCGGLEGDALTDCIIDECEPILAELKTEKPECAKALMAQVGKSAPAALWTVVRPIRKAGVFSYGGSDGLVVASRVPLEETGVLDFTDLSTLNRRRALYADVKTGDVTTRVYCMHLTADLDGVAPYPGDFESWNAENLAQIERLLEHAGAFEGPTVLMGDFNCSIEDTDAGIHGESAASCQAVLDAGWSDPILELDQCTYCASNSLIEDDAHDVLLDHAFVKGWATTDDSRRYDGTVPLEGLGDVSLSDHYGYGVSLIPIPPPPPPEPEAPDDAEEVIEEGEPQLYDAVE